MFKIWKNALKDIQPSILLISHLSDYFEELKGLDSFQGWNYVILGKGSTYWRQAFNDYLNANHSLLDSENIFSVDHDIFLDEDLKIIKSNYKNHFFTNHPIPGKQSIEAARELKNWINSRKKSNFNVITLGGASSLVFDPVEGLNLQLLQEQIRDLLSSKKTIEEINFERNQLCELKNGGLFRLISKNAKEIKSAVVSDVQLDSNDLSHKKLFETIGGGLMADEANLDKIQTLMSPPEFLKIWKTHLEKDLQPSDLQINKLHLNSGHSVDVLLSKFKEINSAAPQRVGHLYSGEVACNLPEGILTQASSLKGGRLSHMAALCLKELSLGNYSELQIGSRSVFASGSEAGMVLGATDGVDGSSPYSFYHLGSDVICLVRRSESLKSKLLEALENFDTGTFFRCLNEACTSQGLSKEKSPGFETGLLPTNLSDMFFVYRL